MPMSEVKREVAKMSRAQIEELAEYAIVHYNDLAMDRVDFLTQVSGKNILIAIKNYKDAMED